MGNLTLVKGRALGRHASYSKFGCMTAVHRLLWWRWTVSHAAHGGAAQPRHTCRMGPMVSEGGDIDALADGAVASVIIETLVRGEFVNK